MPYGPLRRRDSLLKGFFYIPAFRNSLELLFWDVTMRLFPDKCHCRYGSAYPKKAQEIAAAFILFNIHGLVLLDCAASML
jgi:hypothetical protein